MRLASLRTAAAAALALGLSGPLATPPDDSHLAGAAGGGGPREIRPRPVGRRGELFLREGLRAEAEPLLEEGERRIRAVPGPHAWTEALYPVEAVARPAREAGDGDIAAHTAEQMREHDPAAAGTRCAMGAEPRGDTAAAACEFLAAVEVWNNADPALAVRREARARAAKAGVGNPSANGGSSR